MRVAERIRKALKGEIRKWERIADGTGTDCAYRNCPLCKLFGSQCALFSRRKWIPCPVSERTGSAFCRFSPYVVWDSHHVKAHGKDMNARRKIHKNCPECKRLAEAELEFLKSLLSEKEEV